MNILVKNLFDNFRMTIFILTIAIFLWLMMTRQPRDIRSLEWINKPHPSGKYGKYNPMDRYFELIDKYGDPDVIDSSKGGVAIWKKNTLHSRGHCWERVEIHDEQIPHNLPGPHVDFMYTWYKLNVPKNKITDVRALSDSITYDPLKKLIRARCHFSGANTATLLLAKLIANNKITIDEAKKAYGPYILSTLKGHKDYNPRAEQKMINELCK